MIGFVENTAVYRSRFALRRGTRLLRLGMAWTRDSLSCALILLMMLSVPAAAGDMKVAVIYPQVQSAYARVFENIIDGIDAADGIQVLSKTISEGSEVDELNRWLDSEQADALIALGQHGYKIAKQLPSSRPMVVGAALVTPNHLNGISLAADPEQFFKRLGNLTPPVKRVYLVYSEQNNGWLIPLAQAAAKRHSVELHSYEADDTRTAVRTYRDILGEVKDLQDAIWLPLDNIAPDEAVLPMVLEAAWEKKLVVFSNNPSHVKKGALFSLFPDHREMGEELARMVIRLMRGTGAPPGIVPLQDLKVAVNLRTASHLGMLFTPTQRSGFALIYPSR